MLSPSGPSSESPKAWAVLDAGNIDKVTHNPGEYEVQGQNSSTPEEYSYLKRKTLDYHFHHKQNTETDGPRIRMILSIF